MVKFPTSRVQYFWMTDPLDESISCFLIKVDPWVLVPITFRGLYVLAIRGLHILICRGLHALAFRGLRVLIFSVLHIHTLREYKMLHRDLCSRLRVPRPPPDIGGRPTVRAHPEREAITHLLCIPGQDFTRVAAKRRVRIMRTNMTTLTWIWMMLLFSNILPSDHNANLPLQMIAPTRRPVDPKKSNRALGFPALVTGLCQSYRVPVPPANIHMVQLISDTIYCLQESHPQRHPVDPEKSNRALGFPALVTGLCSPTGCPFPPARSRHHDIGIAPARHPVDPKKSNRVLELSSSNYRPLSVLRSACRPQQVLRPQAGAGRNTTAAWGWPAMGNRRTAITSRVHLSSSTKRLERCLRPMADQ
ncbi:hypothetical protein HKD37_02G003671 [Glycine soja]